MSEFTTPSLKGLPLAELKAIEAEIFRRGLSARMVSDECPCPSCQSQADIVIRIDPAYASEPYTILSRDGLTMYEYIPEGK